MAKEDVYQHNFRLNLNNPYHLKIHRQLLNVNKEVYKSKNDYMIRILYDAMFGDTDDMTVPQLKEMEDRITQRVTQELLRTILSMPSMQLNVQPITVTPAEEEKTSEINEELANVALGYFDDWSDLDDE